MLYLNAHEGLAKELFDSRVISKDAGKDSLSIISTEDILIDLIESSADLQAAQMSAPSSGANERIHGNRQQLKVILGEITRRLEKGK